MRRRARRRIILRGRERSAAAAPVDTRSRTKMPCLAVLLALAVPRLLILFLWFFTTWFQGMFDTLLWPVLGLIFLPTSLLWYSAVQHWFGGVWTLVPVLGIVVALLIDLAPARETRRT